MNVYHIFFHWPDGGVWSNLIASGITFSLGWVVSNIFHRRRHRELVANHREIKRSLDNLHAKLDDQKVAELEPMI
jgi:uncharacterized protein (DUF697 family)